MNSLKNHANEVLQILLNETGAGKKKLSDDYRPQGLSQEQVEDVYKYIQEHTPEFIELFLSGRINSASIKKGERDNINTFILNGGYCTFDKMEDFNIFLSNRKLEEQGDKARDRGKSIDDAKISKINARTWWLPSLISVLGIVLSTSISHYQNKSELQDAIRRIEVLEMKLKSPNSVGGGIRGNL